MELHFQLNATGSRIALSHFGINDTSWLSPLAPSRLFAVEVAGKQFDATNLEFVELANRPAPGGVRHTVASFCGPGFTLEQNFLEYDSTALIETWPTIRCTGPKPCLVTRLDSFSLNIPHDTYKLLTYKSGWGNEFELCSEILAENGHLRVESDAGRSSRLFHPWFALQRGSGDLLSGSVAWSGNWIFRFEPLERGGFCASGGLLDRGFEKVLQPADSLEAPPVVLVLGSDLNQVSQQYAAVGRSHWYPNNTLSRLLPVEWNHWWPYEDAEISEEVFLANLEAAARMGYEVCTLDAGWFGPSDTGAHWYDYRGDWALVNSQRFPHGIRPLADQAHALGMYFGIWCEIEALGIRAHLAGDHPEFAALRGDQRLGYVCFGSPAVQEWAYQTLRHLIVDYQADWIKLDFNLDPGLGCDRTDHGHQSGDGLYEHYRGYYSTLARIRAEFPEVILENCSSGGLRIDLGIMRQTHTTFLSDPDWPVHDLQIFWGASTMLAPERLLHWSFGDWRAANPPPQQNFNPHDPALTRVKFDYYTRISMLGGYGASQKLPKLPQWVTERLAQHNQIFKDSVRRFVREGNLYCLTGQPRRSGEGDRLCAFQYSLPDASAHLLFVFHLPGAVVDAQVRLCNLQPERRYTIAGFEDEFHAEMSGQELMNGALSFANLVEEESVLLLIQ
ncbi:MAG: alpha-galactosidase [Anaerolineaceae bacterium]|nr:alpha-galactosidase [Anaerolineaceae bacterium]